MNPSVGLPPRFPEAPVSSRSGYCNPPDGGSSSVWNCG